MLKQLKIQKALEIKRAKLKELETKAADILKRSETTQAALAEAVNEEDLNLLETEIQGLETEQTENDNDKKTVEDEIAALELELEDVNERAKETNKQTRAKGAVEEMKGVNRLQVRELLKTGEYFKRSDVVEFYEKFKNLRAVTGGELAIPEVIVNRIMDMLGDYSTLYPLVDKIQVKGTARILIDTDTTAASWVEQNAALPVGDVGTLAYLDFDGFKVGKVTFVDNYLLQDSVINLDDYVSKKIARAISLALDIAILNGTGAAGKQPSGIIPAIAVGNRVTVAEGAPIAEYVKPIGLIDTGLDSVGEIRAVMRRSTYYNYFLEMSIQVNAAGDIVGRLPNIAQPDILGIPVTFNNSMAADQVLYGEFEKYTLVERENIAIDNSEHVRFVEDQMAFRGKGRFDGKPTKPDAFVLLTITPAV
ncbi:phage major capsid protein [Bacillus sp. ISL-75]|uniref:phage major capsid protein n=1 Tax=Bacillus sp. ISL-75 TaxID=2819137 RepID=UPI001BEB22C6|nr:phage major capsid protein [Bacillus sp. ISL-75]MBT2728391.1 phage major capsid protein [Bacillus sp. ISL-75]